MNIEQIDSFNLMDIFKVTWKWRWKIVLSTFLVTAVVTTVVFLTPKEYLSEATVVAANPILGDRSNIFRTTFEEQFYYYGGGTDNDRLFEMARLDTMKMFLIDSFKLADHYRISQSDPRRKLRAYNELKEKSDFYITELGHVRIKFWDEDRELAAKLANTVVDKINKRSIEMANMAKRQIIEKLEKEQAANEAEVKQLLENNNATLPTEVNLARRTSLLKQIEEKETLINQFRVSLNDINGLYVLQYAYPALKPDRPKRVIAVITAFLASLFFSMLASLLLNRLQKKAD